MIALYRTIPQTAAQITGFRLDNYRDLVPTDTLEMYQILPLHLGEIILENYVSNSLASKSVTPCKASVVQITTQRTI